MKTFTMIVAASLVATAAVAQTSTTAPATTRAAPPTTSTMPNSATPTAGTAGGTVSTPSSMTGTQAAGGNNNQAVATTSANAPQPAKGRNSFSMGEARRRIVRQGYATVSDLKKDNDGVWRGKGTKDGASVDVWLDYKGNVGQQ